MWSKIKYLIKSVTKNLDDYDEESKFDLDDDLPLNKTI